MRINICNSSLNILWVVFIFQFLFTPSQTQQLSATLSKIKLPIPEYGHRALYNGKDVVYLFGSSGSRDEERILRYSISKDTIHEEGSFPVSARHGSVQADWDGNIFYFGADTSSDDKVIKYNPTTNSSSVVARLPDGIFGIPTIKVDNTVLILRKYSARGRDILYFDLEQGSTTRVGVQLPINLRRCGAIKFGKHKAYLVPGGTM